MTETIAIEVLKTDSCYECAQGADSAVDCTYEKCRVKAATKLAIKALEEIQTATKLPCKIGDKMWGIRNYKGCKVAYQGIVSEMFFAPDMSLVIVVKRICRGRLGEKIFFTQAEAEQAIEMDIRRKK